MKKNKLYTVNRFNRPMFMPKENLFAGPFGSSQMQISTSGGLGLLDKVGKTPLPTQLGAKQNQALGAQLSGLASKSPITSGIGSALKDSALSMGAGIIGGLANSAISGGLSTKGGAAISGLGSTIGGAVGAVNPVVGAAITVGTQAIGGLVNRAFGSKLNEEKIAEIKAEQKKRLEENNTLYGAKDTSSLTELVGNLSTGTNFSAGDVGEDGWFSNDAEEKYRQLKAEEERVDKLQELALANATDNVNENNFLNSAKQFRYAYGGPLFNNNDDMGAIGYGFMSDYLLSKNKTAENKTKITNMFMGMPNSMFAFGGDMQTNSADFPTGLTHIGAGGSHEENPNDGVQMGVDNEGTPNLVEEGETVYNDYVFSNRILADEATKQMFKLPKKKDVTFADISKRLEKEIAERPNDPISKAGFEAQMQTLEEQQERQKQEMDAQRAKAAFEALSPEEQVAVMENAAQQEAMAEQAAMQQPSPEEIAMAQQQQAMADGSQAALGQEPQMMAAEGGKLFAPGGYLWDKFWSPVNEYSKKKGNTKGKYQIDKTYKDNIKALEESEAYKAFTDYILNNASDEERLKYFRWIDDNTGRDRVYTNEKGELLDGWQDKYKAARYDGLYGIQHYTPEFDPTLGVPAPEVKPEVVTTPEARVFHAMDGDDYDGYIEGELDPNVVGAEVRRETLPNGDTVIYHGRAKTPAEEKAAGEKGVAPKHRAEWLRYAGLFGPAVGLGMMAARVGRPDTAQLDAAVAGAGDVNTADWKPLGNYLTYRPLDIWFEQNRLNANARATDRAIINNASPIGTKMAGLLAAGYNDQIASGNLFRQAQEYNDNLRKQVAEFNRGTDQFNSEQYGATSRFNADAYNNARRANAQLRLQAAAQKMDADAGWYNSLYGNIAGLFKGIGDIGTENKRDNMINWMISKGIFGAIDPNDPEMKKRVKVVSAEGGKLKKNKRRGLTF